MTFQAYIDNIKTKTKTGKTPADFPQGRQGQGPSRTRQQGGTHRRVAQG